MTAMWREIGAALRLLRLARGWRLAHAAAAAGLPPGRLSRIELGQGSPSHGRLEQLVAALGYPMLALEIARLLVGAGARRPETDRAVAAEPPDSGAALAVWALAGARPAEGGDRELGRCLRLLRGARGWSQRRTAAAARLARAHLSRIERGAPADPAAVAAIVRGLEIAPAQLAIARLLVRLGLHAEERARVQTGSDPGRRRTALCQQAAPPLPPPLAAIGLAVLEKSGGAP